MYLYGYYISVVLVVWNANECMLRTWLESDKCLLAAAFPPLSSVDLTGHPVTSLTSFSRFFHTSIPFQHGFVNFFGCARPGSVGPIRQCREGLQQARHQLERTRGRDILRRLPCRQRLPSVFHPLGQVHRDQIRLCVSLPERVWTPAATRHGLTVYTVKQAQTVA